MRGEHRLDDRTTTSPGHVHVEKNNIGLALPDHLDRCFHLGGLPDQGDNVFQFASHACAEQMMVVDDEDSNQFRHDALR